MNKPFMIFIFSILILTVLYKIFKKVTFQNEKYKKIETFTKELFTIIDNLKNSKCITPLLSNANNIIKNNNIECEKIFLELTSSGNASSPSIIAKYKETYKIYIDSFSNLKDCTEYCFQGDISTGNCICPKEFPFPIQENNKVYCYEEDCTKIPNSTFIPSLSKDPSQNKCICNDGYVKDATNKFQCKKIINCLIDWEYENCDSETGYKYKSRKVLVAPENGGLECPSNLKKVGDIERILSDVKCPVDCVLNDWTDWSQCDLNNETQTRTTTVKYQPKNGGQECPPLTETRKCIVDCEYNWGNWTNCASLCGPGYQFREPIITKLPSVNGKKCPSSPNYSNCQSDGDTCRRCENAPCVPNDCQYTWGNWGECSKPCDGGTQFRDPIIIKPAFLGQPCPGREKQGCNSQSCSVSSITGNLYRSITRAESGQISIPSGYTGMWVYLIGGGGGGTSNAMYYGYDRDMTPTVGFGYGGARGGNLVKNIPLDGNSINLNYQVGSGGLLNNNGNSTTLTVNNQIYTANGGSKGANSDGRSSATKYYTCTKSSFYVDEPHTGSPGEGGYGGGTCINGSTRGNDGKVEIYLY